jgi:hypothetical protein
MPSPENSARAPMIVASLEMDVAGRSPAGALVSEDGVRRAFWGWSEFAAVVEEWRAGARGAGHHTVEEG